MVMTGDTTAPRFRLLVQQVQRLNAAAANQTQNEFHAVRDCDTVKVKGAVVDVCKRQHEIARNGIVMHATASRVILATSTYFLRR